MDPSETIANKQKTEQSEPLIKISSPIFSLFRFICHLKPPARETDPVDLYIPLKEQTDSEVQQKGRKMLH